MSASPHRIGLVLGSGSARGWAHFGVIRALAAAGIRPDLVAGTSIGALVGAAYALGMLDPFEEWVRSLTGRDVVRFLDVDPRSGGLIKGERLMAALRADASRRPIEELALPFAAVATDLRTGEEIWLRNGPAIDAVRASIALPGLFPPVERDGRLLVDGGLVNPVPVSLARAMGAQAVIAVDLSSDMVGSFLRRHAPRPVPSPMEVFVSSMQVMQVRIARNRIAADPPDVLVAPRVSQLGLLDFHRAAEAIDEGRHAVERVAAELQDLVASQGFEPRTNGL